MLDLVIVLRRIKLLLHQVEIVLDLEVRQLVDVDALEVRCVLGSEASLQVGLELGMIDHVAASDRVRPNMISHLVEVQSVLIEVRHELVQRLLAFLVRQVVQLSVLEFLRLYGVSALTLELPLLVVHLELFLGHVVRCFVLVGAHHLFVDLRLVRLRFVRDALRVLLVLRETLGNVLDDAEAWRGHVILDLAAQMCVLFGLFFGRQLGRLRLWFEPLLTLLFDNLNLVVLCEDLTADVIEVVFEDRHAKLQIMRIYLVADATLLHQHVLLHFLE